MRWPGLLLSACLAAACAQKPAEWAPVPIQGGERTDIPELFALAADDLWGVSRPDVFHFDGKQWALTGSPGAEHLWAAAHDDVWGVGRGGSWFHYDGKAWTSGRVEAAAKKYLDFYGVVAWPGEVWATAGVEGYFRFDGKEWTAVFPPELDGWELKRIWAIGREVYVALSFESGQPGHRAFKAAIGHFDGKAWTRIDEPSGMQIRGSASDDLWLVMKRPRHFDGKQWVETQLPDESAVIYDLFARGPAEAYAVGKKGFAARWDGKVWRELPTGIRHDLFTVNGGKAGPVWAGGALGKMLRYPK